jgi:hypothetical protein
MVHVAILYWGKTRTFGHTFPSHKKHIFDVLDNKNITYDKYMHTWAERDNDINFYEQFNFKKIEIEDQSNLINEINDNFSEYWYEQLYNLHGKSSLDEWCPNMVKRGLYGLTSKKYVTQLCIESGIKYDLIFYIRPDIMFYTDLEDSFINISTDTIVVPRLHWGGIERFGINDTFAILNFYKAKEFGFCIDETKYYRKYIGRIAGEHYIGYIVQKYFKNIIYSDIKFDILR